MTDSRREELLREKLSEMSIFEEELYNRGLELIAGVDEVGRGCLAGPGRVGSCNSSEKSRYFRH